MLLACVQMHAVLKEKDLARTLSVLRAELAADHEKMQQFITTYERQGEQQHEQLVSYMTQCEQIGLMLYSQSTDNIFDMAYACQQASALYRELLQKQSKRMQYDKMIEQMKREVERYEDLITTLRTMPPIDEADRDSLLTESDSILLSAIDSLDVAISQHASDSDSVESALIAEMPDTPFGGIEEGETNGEPLYLSGQELIDRKECVEYAETMRNNLLKFLDEMEAESVYYQSVREKVKKLNEFAQSRYKVLQDNIFRNGDTNYFSVLAHLPSFIGRVKSTLEKKYKPLEGHEHGYSEWRGTYVLYLSVFVVFYILVALIVSYLLLRLVLPKKWRTPHYKHKRHMLNNVVGIALFAIFVMVVRAHVDRNFIQMGTGLIINIAWLMEVIFLSLFIRLKGTHLQHAAHIYYPLMIMAFIVIMFRIVLVPTILANLIYPPILLAFTIWQSVCNRKYAKELPGLDRVYANISTTVMAVSCIMAVAGYTLMAVQVMIWWTFQLAAIMTVTLLYDIMTMFENRWLVFRIFPKLKEEKHNGHFKEKDLEHALHEMKDGKHFGKTWFYDFVNMTLVPVFAVLTVVASLYEAGSVFEMTDMFIRGFYTNFINEEGLIQVSASKLCVVIALWFIFKYLNYAGHSLFTNYKRSRLKLGDTLNTTMGNNVISIIVWGLYFMTALVILHVPRSGISVVGAGLATGVGFAMQSILENFFYGISLMAGRLRVGDYIECDGVTGRVESITYQSTQIITADGCVIAFLNSALFSKNFKNRTRNHHYELTKIPFGVAYGTDVDEVREAILKALEPLCQEKNAHEKPVVQPGIPPTVVFSEFGESSVDLFVCIWILVEEKIGLMARLRELIYNTLNEHGIEIPFPQRDVHMKN